MARTQAKRRAKFQSPLGPDALILHSFRGTEELGRLSRIEVELLSEDGTIPFKDIVGQNVTSVLRGPGRHVQSLGDSSFDAWIKFYRRDENSPNSGVSYYAKGALVALALDLTLRNSGTSLDELMRALWQRHGPSGVGVPEDGIELLAIELGGAHLAQFFARFVEGTEDPPLEALMREFGVAYRLRPSEAGHALAASELVAAGLGKPAPGISPEAQRVAEALRPRVDELRADARAAVERLRQNPDPHDQWDVPDAASEAAEADSRDWRTQMDLLAMRLAD